jgi:hypothetical protein
MYVPELKLTAGTPGVPAKFTVCGTVIESPTTPRSTDADSCATLDPTGGAYSTTTLQLCPAASVDPHPPLTRLKSAPPVIVGLKLIELFPVFCSTATVWLDVVPTNVIPKLYETWLS